MQITEIRIANILVGDRFRKDFGDIEALANSIDELGLLQPIGITSGAKLVFGERRLRAFQHLGRDSIPARVVNLNSILAGEYAENEFRKDWTVSERVAISKALETEYENRVGRPSSKVLDNRQIKDKCPEFPNGQTRDIVAKAAGFGSGKTYERAKRVVEEGSPEIIEAVDASAMSIALAAEVLDLPDESRDVIASAPLEKMREVALEEVKKAHVANNSGNNEWYTPAKHIELARTVMGGIDTDPASSSIANATVKAAQFFTADDDGRTKTWTGRVWMNPPYAQPLMGDFAEAVSSKFESGEIEQACILVNNATETQWFQRMLSAASAVCFPRSRIKFIDPSGNPSGAPLQGQAIIYMGDRIDAFAKVFCEEGAVLLND